MNPELLRTLDQINVLLSSFNFLMKPGYIWELNQYIKSDWGGDTRHAFQVIFNRTTHMLQVTRYYNGAIAWTYSLDLNHVGPFPKERIEISLTLLKTILTTANLKN